VPNFWNTLGLTRTDFATTEQCAVAVAALDNRTRHTADSDSCWRRFITAGRHSAAWLNIEATRPLQNISKSKLIGT